LENKVKHIIISGGGTGGHLFPAIAIAQALEKSGEKINILFVGAKGKIEEEKVPALGYNIELLDIAGFQRRFTFKNISFFFKLFKSISKSKQIIKKFNPDIAVGVGGYASGPLLRVASKNGIPYVLQEQNSFPGITNKMLAKNAEKICVAYEGTERFFPKEKIIITGNPVRESLKNVIETKEEAKLFFGINPQTKLILSLGGSLGAGTINKAIGNSLKSLIDSGSSILWQTGKLYYKDCKKAADEFKSDSVKVTDFITRMDLAYRAADIVISRAGAGTISELCLLGKAFILVPSPNVAEDHQTKNALALVKGNAAILIPDIEADNLLVKTALKTLKEPVKLQELSNNSKKFAVEGSADKIAKEILKIVERKK